MKVVGIDLSLARTGLATWTPAGMSVDVIVSKLQAGVDALERIRTIREAVIEWARGADLAVVEDLTLAGHRSATMKLSERSGLYWMTLDRLQVCGVPYACASPKGLKLFATGTGNASKGLMMETARITWPEAGIRHDDEADAAWLAAMGATHLGETFASVTELQASAVSKIEWPRAA